MLIVKVKEKLKSLADEIRRGFSEEFDPIENKSKNDIF